MPNRISLLLLALDANDRSQRWQNDLRQWSRFDRVIVITDETDLVSSDDRHPWLSVASLAPIGADESCLCCGLNTGLGDHLRKIFFEALSAKVSKLEAVLVVSRKADPEAIQFTLKHTPFLGQRYCYLGVVPINSTLKPHQLENWPSSTWVEGLENMLANTLH